MLDIEKLLQDKCEELLKTLPLAHYLKVGTIPVAFDKTSSTSYFDPTQFRIVVAFNNIAMVINSKKALPNELELEKTIRCFLYHELSHAMLTPADLMRIANESSYFSLLTPRFANILEDERIETTLSHYYLDVDFKENLRNASPLDKHIKSFEHFVFNCVRHRCSPIMAEQVNRLVDQFIRETSKVSAFGDVYLLATRMNELLEGLKVIFDSIPKVKSDKPDSSKGSGKGKDSESSEEDNSEESESTEEETESSSNEESEEETENDSEDNEEDQEDSSEEENGSTEESDSEESDENESDSESEDTEESEDSSEEETEDDTISQSELEDLEDNAEELTSELVDSLTAEEIEKIMEEAAYRAKRESSRYGNYKLKLSDHIYDKDTKTEMLKIIGRNMGFGINKAPTQFGYNGKFNTKRFATDFNDSCKWFAKRAYEETGINNKKNNTKVLNIWLDNSGSYGSNDFETNKILRALQTIEQSKENFKFNLITFETHFHLRSGEERISVSGGENCLPKKEIESIYHKVNEKGTELNIVLFDGRASEYMGYSKERDSYENLKIFNNKNTIFISERSNIPYIKNYCGNCKAIIEENRNYTSKLKENILKAFDLLF